MKQKLFSNIKRFTSVFSLSIIIITIIILLLRLTVFSNPAAPATDSPESSSVDKPSKAETSSQVDGEEPAVLDFKYTIAGRITFKDFKATANPKIKNDPENTALMQVKIIRNDTKTSLYESGYIKPGINETAIKLDGTPLEAGVYECTVEIIVLDKESLKPVETLTQPIVVEIENTLDDGSSSEETSSK